ncbi:MAG: hypothetical protein A2X08_17920 [Bacteroidetes bacterium GWA2_32_17]|nr:MAG: hypothetical protein A2X08_17920 [Bacteroidetes bacterium GWA2_32_17]
MKKTLLIVIVLLSISGITFPQTSPVKIIDLAVIPGIKADTTLQLDSTDLIVNFKIKNSNQALIAYFLFGTAPDLNDIFSVNGTFFNQSGTMYLITNGYQNEITDYSAQAFIKLSGQQNTGFNYLTVYVEDNTGLITDKLYFHK